MDVYASYMTQQQQNGLKQQQNGGGGGSSAYYAVGTPPSGSPSTAVTTKFVAMPLLQQTGRVRILRSILSIIRNSFNQTNFIIT